MPTRKQEQERRRSERLAAEKEAQDAARRRLTAGYIVAGALGVAVVVGLVIVLASGGGDTSSADAGCAEAHIQVLSGSTHDYKPDCREGTPPPPIATGDLEQAAKAGNCELRLNLPDEGNTHITDPSQIPDYKTNPPTSGNHNPEQEADGAYAEQPDAWYVVHSMEHGRIEIQYSPDLPEDDQLALKGVFDESPAGVLLFPNADMPYEVAATAWTQLIGCKTYEGEATLDAIRDFRDIYRGHAPENLPIVTG